MLTSEHIAENGKVYDGSFINFDEALELYYAHLNKGPPHINTDKDAFQYALLHQTWGLCVYVIFVETLKKRLIVLRPDSFDLDAFLVVICKEKENESIYNDEIRMDLNAEKIKAIMNTCDTEWDRKIARVLLSANCSRSQIDSP